MTKTKRVRRTDHAQVAIMRKSASGLGAGPDSAIGATPTAEPNQLAPKPAPRTAQLLILLSTHKGASLNEICVAFGWQPHSTRAFLSGLRKSGFEIERINLGPPDETSGALAKSAPRYRITNADGAVS